MSRSRKKTPIFNNGSCKGRKQDRILANRKFRRLEHQAIQNGDFEVLIEKVSEVSDVWSWDCDGWRYYDPNDFTEDYQESWDRK